MASVLAGRERGGRGAKPSGAIKWPSPTWASSIVLDMCKRRTDVCYPSRLGSLAH